MFFLDRVSQPLSNIIVTYRDVEENSKELLVQVWDSNTYLNNELIGEVKINLDVFLRKKGSVKVRSDFQ